MDANVDLQELETRLKEAEDALRRAEQVLGRLKEEVMRTRVQPPPQQQTKVEPVEQVPGGSEAVPSIPSAPGTLEEAPQHSPEIGQSGQPVQARQDTQPQGTPAEPASPTAEAAQNAPPQQPEGPEPKPGQYKVEFDRENCIGAGACVAANAEYWSIEEDGKATLKTASFDKEKNLWVLFFDEADLQKHMDAAGVCPVNVIHVFDPEGNQQI